MSKLFLRHVKAIQFFYFTTSVQHTTFSYHIYYIIFISYIILIRLKKYALHPRFDLFCCVLVPINITHNLHTTTSSNGTIFRVTVHLWGETTGLSPVDSPNKWKVTRSFIAFCSKSKQAVKQTLDWLVIRYVMGVTWRRRNGYHFIDNVAIIKVPVNEATLKMYFRPQCTGNKTISK